MKRSVTVKMIALLVTFVAVIGIGGYVYHLNGDSLDFSGTDVRVVVTGSMDGELRTEYDIDTIPVESAVFIHKVPDGPSAYAFYTSLKIGDVVTFHYKNPVTREDMIVTHRITDISDSYGDIKYTMAGDAIIDDPTNSSVQVVYASSGDIVGKVVGVSQILGSLMVFLSSADGKAILLGAFASILFLIWFGPAIFKHVSKDRTKKEV